MYSMLPVYTDPLLGEDASELSTSEAITQDTTTLAVMGAVDMATANLLRRHALNALERKPPRLVLDLCQVNFLGSTGLALLMEIRQLAEKQGTTLLIRARGHRIVMRPLEATGLVHLFTVVN